MNSTLANRKNAAHELWYASRPFSDGAWGEAMKRAAIYLRVSTQDQTTSNQEHELRQAAERAGWQVVKVYKDHGISGAKGRNGRPAFDTLCRDATKRQFDVVMAWNVDRLGRRPCGVPVRASRAWHRPDHRHCRLLCAHLPRPSGRRAAEQRDELLITRSPRRRGRAAKGAHRGRGPSRS
jgi:Resolvase, N terminal domain